MSELLFGQQNCHHVHHYNCKAYFECGVLHHLAPRKCHILAKPARYTVGVVYCLLAGCIGPLVRLAAVIGHLALYCTTHHR